MLVCLNVSLQLNVRCQRTVGGGDVVMFGLWELRRAHGCEWVTSTLMFWQVSSLFKAMAKHYIYAKI